jgi:hypothetical protein
MRVDSRKEKAAMQEMGFRRAVAALGRLTNGPTSYSVWLTTTGINMVNHAECVTTPHGSDPTLGLAVTGLPRIIQDRETSVLCDHGGPSDSSVSVGRRGVPVGGGRKRWRVTFSPRQGRSGGGRVCARTSQRPAFDAGGTAAACPGLAQRSPTCVHDRPRQGDRTCLRS